MKVARPWRDRRPSGEQTAQATDEVSPHVLMAGQLNEATSQVTTFVTPLIRQLFESPYTHHLRLQLEPTQNRLMSVTARPADRLTDTHLFFGRRRHAAVYQSRRAGVHTVVDDR